MRFSCKPPFDPLLTHTGIFSESTARTGRTVRAVLTHICVVFLSYIACVMTLLIVLAASTCAAAVAWMYVRSVKPVS